MALQLKPNSECVRVVVRIRPISEKERQDGRKIVVFAQHDRSEITLHPPGDGGEELKNFTFDQVYGMVQREQVFV
jgi:kinesin family member 3B